MTKKLGFGLIGLGEIAYTATAKVLQQTQNATMLAGVDPVEHVCQSFENTYHIPCSMAIRDVLDHPDVDAVIVSTPHVLHAPLAIEAAHAGKHVVVEKPMATTVEDAKAIVSACQAAGVLCSAKEGGVRYQPSTLRARELIHSGAIGEVMAIQIYGAANKPASYWTGGYTGRVQTTWRKSKAESGGGILIMNYIYDIFRIRFVTGLEVHRVFAEYDTYRTDVEVEDFITVSLRLSNGALGTITASSCAPGASIQGMRGSKASGNRIYGTAGQIVFEDGDLLVYTDKEIPGLQAGEWTQLTFPPEGMENAWLLYFQRFADVALNGGKVDVPGEEGVKDLEVILAAYQSGESHKPVSLPECADRANHRDNMRLIETHRRLDDE
jgi:UDP-N-acetyl-2-amino-2-deoxyglucuronate dehydrogenase